MKNWLDKYDDGGEVNNNDFSMSAPEGWVGSGTFNKGRDYSPAWGGQFADGGEVGDNKYRDPEHKSPYISDLGEKIINGISFVMDDIPAAINTGIGKVISPFVYNNITDKEKEELFKKYRPIEYPTLGKAIGRTIKNNFSSEGPTPVRYDDKGNLSLEEEAWRKALNLPVKSNYIRESKYRPTTATDPNAKYYTLHPNVIDSQKLIDYATSDAWDKNKKLSKSGKEYLQMSSFAPFMKQDFIDRQTFEENQSIKDMDPLQRFQIYKGYDPKKKKNYISISDRYDFDFAPAQKVIKPYDFYDRFYYANGGSLPGAVGFMYARTNDPAPSNGPYAKKTKASAENGTEMRFYQEGLDWKPKTISKDGSNVAYVDNTRVGVVPRYIAPKKGKDQPISNMLQNTVDVPQRQLTKLFTGKEQYPSEAMGIENPYGVFAVDAITDPINFIGAGVTQDLLKNAYKINPFAFKTNPENFYRMIGNKNGLNDLLSSEIVRNKPGSIFQDYPAFYSKGNPIDGRYSKSVIESGNYAGPYMVEVKNSGKTSVGNAMNQEHWLAKNAPDPNIYNSKNPVNLLDSDLTLYKQHWLQGYKKLPKKEDGGQLEKLDQLTNFTNYNTKQPGGWLDKYEG